MVDKIPLSEIVPYQKNPRKNDRAVDIVMRSIKEYGFQNPIILDKNNVIIAGHTRFKAAQKLGLTEVPVIWAELTEEQTKGLRLADNKTAEYSDWDYPILKEELIDLKNFGFDLKLTGFSENELSKLIPNEDGEKELPDLEKPKYTILNGDIYQLGRHRLICGDSTKEQDVKLLINNNKIDAIITDPPYGVDYALKNKLLNQLDGSKRIEKEYANDEIERDYNIFYNDFLDSASKYLNEYNQIYIFLASSRMYECLKSFKDLDFQTSMILVWVKNNHVMARTDYLPKHEFIIYGWKGKHKFYGKGPQSVFNYNKPLVNDLHPTMKPIELMSDIIRNASQEGMIIYDGFGGSGTTLIACEQTNRICYMMELDPLYCSVIVERWENLTKQKAVKL